MSGGVAGGSSSFGMGGGQCFHQAAAANAVVQTFGKTLRSDAVVSVDVAPAPAALNARPPPAGGARPDPHAATLPPWRPCMSSS
eukprot:tig00001128_g7169.t1